MDLNGNAGMLKLPGYSNFLINGTFRCCISKLTSICLVLLFSLFIYGVKFSFFPLDLYRCLYIVFIVLFFFRVVRFRVARVWFYLIFLSLFVLAYSLFISFYNRSFELTFSRMVLDYFLTFLIFVPVFYKIVEYLKLDILKLIIYVAAMQAIVMFLMLAIPSFQKLVLSIIDTNGIERSEGAFRFRGVGFTGLATYSMAVTQSFALYLFHIYWSKRLSVFELLYSIFLFILIFFSALLSARTSLIFLLSLLFSYLIIYFFTKNENLIKAIKFMFVLLFVTFFSVISILATINSPEIVKLLEWGGEVIFSFLNNGSASTASTDAMKSLFFIPEDYTILFGDGHYLSESGEYYMFTDIGYLRVLLYGGILGSSLFYSIFIYLSFLLLKSVKSNWGALYSVPLFIYSALLFVVNIKGSIFFDGFIAIKLMTIFAFYLLQKNSEIKYPSDR